MKDPKELMYEKCLTLSGKDFAYMERDILVSLLSKLYPSHLTRHPVDESWEDDWRTIVCIHSPTGQLTWHIHDSEMGFFTHLEMQENHWDGHSTAEKYKRVLSINESKHDLAVKCMQKLQLKWKAFSKILIDPRWHNNQDFLAIEEILGIWAEYTDGKIPADTEADK
jgi:hypothetical protein